MKRLFLLILFGGLLAAAVIFGGIAKADPYCGAGSNYDYRHQICQPGNPVPFPGFDPAPLPGDYPGQTYPRYGSN